MVSMKFWAAGLATVASVVNGANAWSIERGEVAVAGAGLANERVSFSSLDGSVLQLPVSRSLDVAFKIPEAPPRPHQAMLRIAHVDADTGATVERLYQAKIKGKSAKVVLPHKTVPWELRETPLKASIIVASFEGEPVEIPAFDLVVFDDEHSAAAKKQPSAEKLAAKPEIIHQFRPQPRHINVVIAGLAVIAVSVAFIALLGLWSQTGIFSSTAANHSSAVYINISSLVAIEAVFFAYYIQLSILNTLGISSLFLAVLLWSQKRL